MRPGLLALSAACLLAAPAAAQHPATADVPLPTISEPAPVGFQDAISTGLAAVDPATPHAWASVDYLRWWIRPQNSMDLVQTVPGDVAALNSNSLPAGSTTRVFPRDRDIKYGGFNGVRATLGFATERFGYDITGFGLEEKTSSASASSNGLPFAVAQSYVGAGNGANTSLLASLAGQYSGSADASSRSRVYGIDTNVRTPFYRMLADWNHAILGFRYFDLQESLNINSNSTFAGGSRLAVTDEVLTRNQFYGGQIGLASRYGSYERGLGLDSTIKLALGGTRQYAELSGSNAFVAPNGLRDTANGGLYVQPSNAGVYDRTKVAMLTEYDLNLTYNFSPRTQVYFGYSLIWISSVVRPAELLDPVINDSRIRYVSNAPASNSNQPAFRWVTNDFWTQGLNVGLRFQY